MSDTPTLFDKIVDGTIPSRKVWEDDRYVAFLTPFPNTPGFTVVVPKQNPGDNFLDVTDDAYAGLLLAAKKVARLLRKGLNVERVGLVIEGEAVPHLHVKLIPMHGLDKPSSTAPQPAFYATYPGYLSTAEGPAMDAAVLDEIQAKIRKAAA